MAPPLTREAGSVGRRREVVVAVVGGGKAGLGTGVYLRRAGMTPGEDFVIVDAAGHPGGSWPQMWEWLRLFTPPTYSSLRGWMMPARNAADNRYPP